MKQIGHAAVTKFTRDWLSAVHSSLITINHLDWMSAVARQRCRPLFRRQLHKSLSQYMNQFPEMWFVIAPQVDRAGVNRPADLLGAGGLDRSLRFVESEACILERQPAK